MQVGLIGISHKTASIGERENVARAVQALLEHNIFLNFPFVILSTCNRTEIYFSSDDLATAQSDLLAYLRLQMGHLFEHNFYSLFYSDCFYHLCQVTAGFDSAVMGETEIQGQVKDAYLRSTKNSLHHCLHFAFQK